MPEISRFYGIVIRMNFRDHAPPHFHAEYGDDEMAVGISPVRELAGRLPRRAAAMVLDWAAIHQSELLNAWKQIQARAATPKIDPLP
jgi:Domain of unknown function (DUF4160)